MKHQHSHRSPALEAYGTTCPTADEVTYILAGLGFSLKYTLPATHPAKSSTMPALPAQYHYHDAVGTEVVFLAGRDASLGDIRLPPHKARWWLYPGASSSAYTTIAQALTAQWTLHWSPSLPGLSSRAS